MAQKLILTDQVLKLKANGAITAQTGDGSAFARSYQSMNLTIETVWTAHTTDDERGRSADLIGIFSTEGTAKGAAFKKGWYGGNGNVEKRQVVLVGDGEGLLLDRVIHYPVMLDANLRQQRVAKLSAALAKLTAEEIDLLGIKAW